MEGVENYPRSKTPSIALVFQAWCPSSSLLILPDHGKCEALQDAPVSYLLTHKFLVMA
jgi:hypothetical protein